MKKRMIPLLCALLLMGCAAQEPEETPAETTVIPIVAPTEAPTESTAETSTEASHSALYIPGVPVEDVITYFNEVCLNAEFINGGDPSFLQRWEEPILFTVHGHPTEDDWTHILEFSALLNTITGFPGMYEAGPEDFSNLRIHFRDQQGLLDIMGDSFAGMDGAVTFWYDNDVIFDANICVRTDLDQHLRNSVILEEIYNGLGPIQDTTLRPDSIIYSEFSQPQALTEMDELILRLLYHPDMKCGMNADECEAVIRALYYEGDTP